MVKSYYMLTDEEKQLLRDYMLWNQETPFYAIMIFLSLVIYFVLLIIGIVIESYTFEGMGVLGVMLSQLLMYWFFKKTKKTNRMIFGFNNPKEFFFEIDKKEDKMTLRELFTPEGKEE